MNHAKLATEALRFRLAMLPDSTYDAGGLDRTAAFAVSCGDPLIDSAIRRLGEAWLRAGLPLERICEPWTGAEARRLLAAGGPQVIDALDDIMRGVANAREPLAS